MGACADGHAAAKVSEASFRQTMLNVTEAAPVHGRGGLWGHCPLCQSTCMYRRPDRATRRSP